MTTTTATIAEPAISLTSSEECALEIALMLIDSELNRAVIVLGQDAEDVPLRDQRNDLDGLLGRWHRANCLAKQGQLHTTNCNWCKDGSE